jgi:hypothetical protein
MDLTEDEIKKKYFGMKKKDHIASGDDGDKEQRKNIKFHKDELPTYVNWKKVIELPIREQ